MNQDEFNKYYINTFLEKLAMGKRRGFLLDDSKINLLDNEKHILTNEFLDSLSFFLPYILLPTRITSNSKTLMDNINYSYVPNGVIPGNLTATIYDYLPEYLIGPHIFCNPSTNKTSTFKANWSKS